MVKPEGQKRLSFSAIHPCRHVSMKYLVPISQEPRVDECVFEAQSTVLWCFCIACNIIFNVHTVLMAEIHVHGTDSLKCPPKRLVSWVKCLTQGYRASRAQANLGDFEPGTLWFPVQCLNHMATLSSQCKWKYAKPLMI